ncbi:hypothetical protein RJ55_07767 [Drechmeria coniospora]|nr:hypothetical protein RJ55_07767 [Drechmeria coniospora]
MLRVQVKMRMRKVVLTSSEVSVLLSITTSGCPLAVLLSLSFASAASHGVLLTCAVVLCTLALFLSGYALQQRTLRHLRAAIRPRESLPSPEADVADRFRRDTTELADGTVVVIGSAAQAAEANPTARRKTEEAAGDVEKKGTDGASEEQLAVIAQLQAQVAAKSWGVPHPDPLSKSKIPITAAERRRLIKEEIRRASQADESAYRPRRRWCWDCGKA